MPGYCLLSSDHPVIEFWQVIAGKVPGRAGERQITLFDSVGFAIEDVCALGYVRDRLKVTGQYEELDLLAAPTSHADFFGMILPAAR
ncbi:hypothetical protein LCM4579_27995 [Ensifer sp. LCM 4579]|nr:hypothetical protein LCM4579_27995 [Ensifer sp. LCM 4579]